MLLGFGTRGRAARRRAVGGGVFALTCAAASCRTFEGGGSSPDRVYGGRSPMDASGAGAASNAGSDFAEVGGVAGLERAAAGGPSSAGAGHASRAGQGGSAPRASGQGGANAQLHGIDGDAVNGAGFGAGGDGGAAGEGGQPGGAGAGGHAGTPDACSESGACNEPGAAGAEGIACDPEVENVNVECISASFAEYPIRLANGAAVSGVSDSEGFQLYVSKRDSDTVGTSWTDYVQYGFRPGTTCFDALPAPSRLAGTTLLDDEPEVFAIGRCGTVFGRKFLHALYIWTPWAQVTLPDAAGSITDVSLTRLPGVTNFMYVTNGRAVFVRHRIESTPGSAFGGWTKLGGRAGSIVAAGTRSDGRQQVFTLDALGRPLTSVQSSSDVDSSFGTWSDFDSAALPPLVDIEGIDGLVPLEVFALGADGSLWWREEDEAGGFTAWEPAAVALDGLVLRAVSGAGLYGLAGHEMALVGVAEGSGVFANERIDGAWRGWQAMF